FQDQLIFLRSDYTAAEEFPCVFIPARPPHRHSYASDTQPPSLPVCTRVVLYLHGNAEDLGLATEFFEEHICDEINSHVFIVEYPGLQGMAHVWTMSPTAEELSSTRGLPIGFY
ncbi:hypothetical protein SARC_16898, partial [Sphaeroforma arctica JP610]